VARSVGISFHVGSQMLRPQNYTRAIAMAAEIARTAGVTLDYLDVGGGFPSRHPQSEPPPMSKYINEIKQAVREFGLDKARLLCEPGRALVAESESVIVQVIGRRGHNLHVSDGTYGCFFEAAKIYGGLSYPTRLIRGGKFVEGPISPFVFWGPSCDSIDHMPGPFHLPEDVREGDYIEVGHLGAYGRVSRSNFNGFGAFEQVILCDEPMATMYPENAIRGRSRRLTVVSHTAPNPSP
jgi:ornithine decarboxylase